jgi:cobalt/nickel transport system ATP-binding protein
MSDVLVRLEGVQVARAGTPVLDGVDLSIESGARLGIGGPNGAGKTTLLRAIVGLQPLRAGTVWAFGRPRTRPADFHEVRLRVGLLFQNADDQLFCPTVLEDVTFGPRNQGLSAAEADERARATLADLGLEALADRPTHRLSGGEQRMVALATVLAMRPDVVLLDEPLAGLDEASEERLLSVLDGLPQAMVVVSHQPTLEARLGLTPLRLASGRLRSA